MKAKMFVKVCAVVLLLSGMASATVTITGDTTALPWTGGLTGTSAYVGSAAAGTLTMAESSDTLVNRYTYVGYYAAGDGTVTMSGGSKLTTNAFFVAHGYLGSKGKVVLDDVGTKITVDPIESYGVAIGRKGNGEIQINNGAQLDAKTITIAYGVGAVGTLKVDGAGSKYTNTGTVPASDFMSIGSNTTTGTPKAQAYVDVTNGGSIVCNTIVYLGYGTAARNYATGLVDGAGSSWSSATDFIVGRYGNAALTITNSGLVKVGGILSMNVSATGALIKMDSEGKLALKDIANVGSASITDFLSLISSGAGFEKDIKYFNGTAYASILGATAGVDYNLAHFTTGDLAGYTMLTVPEPATIGILTIGMISLLARRQRKV